MDHAIGIDLGTTYSCVAYVDGDQPKVIPFKGNQFTVPSMVAIDEKGNRLVGHDAKRQQQLNPSNTIYGAKRFIGRDFSESTVAKIKEHFAYEVTQSDEGEVLITLGGRKFRLHEISAMVLEKLVDIAQEHFQARVKKAVVTVPAYFNDRQRQAVRDAGELIGLEILRIINEPTAAALAYGLGKHLNQTVLVYDLGGGTFDVSVLEIRDRIFEVKATGGDTFLGGVDWDNRLIDHILRDFLERTGVDLSDDQIAKMRVKDAAENAKLELSAARQTTINIPFITKDSSGQPLNVDITVTRQEFEDMTADLLDRTVEITQQVMHDAGMNAADIEQVLLVGGMSRVPAVTLALTELLGRPPSKAVHADEAIAKGAALLAHALTDNTVPQVVLLDVLSQSIGIGAADGRFIPIFVRNSSIPNAKAKRLTTSQDRQVSLNLKIYQGESDVAQQNELLGNFIFSGITPAAAGDAQIEAQFEISEEGTLRVSACDPATGRAVETTIQVRSALGG